MCVEEAMPNNNEVSIRSAKGTIYFINQRDGLAQGYDLIIDNPGEPFDAELSVKWGKQEYASAIGTVVSGESTVRVYIPDVREQTKMTFGLKGEACKDLEIEHQPQRHWTVHLIQFAHHDLGYTDIPTNVFKDFCLFYDDVLRFCRETDHFPEESKFRYTIEQGWSLLYYLEHRPQEVREEMMRRIREGRVEVNAFLGNETTELLGPEEMVRMLYPVFELKRKYGIPVTSAEHNDIPGISWGVAAAMAGAGVKWFAPALPDYFRWGENYHTFWDEDLIAPNSLPVAFNWEAPNGEKILFWYGRQGAGGQVDVTLRDLPSYLEKLQGSDYPYDVLRYITMGGMRDNAPPRVEFAYTSRDWNEKWAYPRFVQSLNSKFFPELEEQLGDVPTYRGELPGTDYSVAANCTAYPSSLNRVTHDQLLAAERIATIASELTPYEYPKEMIDEAYYCALLNDEHAWGLAHPVGPGQDSCIAQHCEFAYRAAAHAHNVLNKAVNEFGDHVSRDEDGYYALIFNPTHFARTDIATAPQRPMDTCAMRMKPVSKDQEAWGDRPLPLWGYTVSNREMIRIPKELFEDGFEVIDVTTGKTVPHEVYEVSSPQAPVPYAAYRYSMGTARIEEKRDVRFLAEDVPAMGYKVYRFVPSKKRPARPQVTVGRNTLENRFYKVELDPRTGAIKSIFDKDLGKELVDQNAEYGANQMVIRSSVTAERVTSAKATIERGRSGAISGSLIVKTQAIGYPQITQEIILYSDIKRIDIANRVLKDSTAHLETYFAFPFAMDKPKFKYEGSLSIIEPLEDQFPGSNSEYYSVQHWADVYGSEHGVAISSLDAPMMQFGDNWTLYVSQAHHLYTPPNFDHPFHTKKDVKKGHIYSFVLVNNYGTNFQPMQNGDLLFRYSITSHEGDWKKGRASDFGYGVSVPFVHAGLNGSHKGGLPVSSSYCELDQDNVVLLAVKRAEDGNGFVVRVMETEGVDTEVTITLPFINVVNGYETNLVEENQRALSISRHSVKVKVNAWDVATVRVMV